MLDSTRQVGRIQDDGMRRKIKLALIGGAVAAMAAPAAPAHASMICETGDPATQKVVCGTYYVVGGVVSKVTKSCWT